MVACLLTAGLRAGGGGGRHAPWETRMHGVLRAVGMHSGWSTMPRSADAASNGQSRLRLAPACMYAPVIVYRASLVAAAV